jgi:hypothetical protein
MRLKIENEERRRRRRTIKSARVSQILVGGQVKCMPIDLNRAQGPNGPYLFSAIVGRLTAEFSARFYLFAGFRQEPALRRGECLLPN